MTPTTNQTINSEAARRRSLAALSVPVPDPVVAAAAMAANSSQSSSSSSAAAREAAALRRPLGGAGAAAAQEGVTATLSGLLPELLYRIFEYLPLPDVSRVSQTSKQLHGEVRGFKAFRDSQLDGQWRTFVSLFSEGFIGPIICALNSLPDLLPREKLARLRQYLQCLLQRREIPDRVPKSLMAEAENAFATGIKELWRFIEQYFLFDVLPPEVLPRPNPDSATEICAFLCQGRDRTKISAWVMDSSNQDAVEWWLNMNPSLKEAEGIIESACFSISGLLTQLVQNHGEIEESFLHTLPAFFIFMEGVSRQFPDPNRDPGPDLIAHALLQAANTSPGVAPAILLYAESLKIQISHYDLEAALHYCLSFPENPKDRLDLLFLLLSFADRMKISFSTQSFEVFLSLAINGPYPDSIEPLLQFAIERKLELSLDWLAKTENFPTALSRALPGYPLPRRQGESRLAFLLRLLSFAKQTGAVVSCALLEQSLYSAALQGGSEYVQELLKFADERTLNLSSEWFFKTVIAVAQGKKAQNLRVLLSYKVKFPLSPQILYDLLTPHVSTQDIDSIEVLSAFAEEYELRR